MKLQTKGTPTHMPAEVLIKRKKRKNGVESWEVVRARGHLDEVSELRAEGAGEPDSERKKRAGQWVFTGRMGVG